jgi:hypothetical protein
MAECIDCGAYVIPPEKHCDDCKEENFFEPECTCLYGCCVLHGGDKEEGFIN